MARLRRFLPPQIVDIVLSGGKENMLAAHRREVTVVSCDLRGFTSFSETSEPEEVMAILSDYHCSLGEIIFQHGGTLESIAGDGMLVLFNDPVEYADHPARAVRMALNMRERMDDLTRQWHRLGHELGFGVGISQGFVTVGAIGFEARQDYAAIGTATNLACRLCDEAKHGEILISQRVFSSLESSLDVGRNDIFTLKGFRRPVPAYELLGWRD
jgi:class 3 adenylate cyclase